MAKEYRITTIKKIYANGTKKQKDIEFCLDLNKALEYVDFNEKDLEFIRVIGYIIPEDGGCEDLYDQSYYIGKVVAKEGLTDREINSAMLRYSGFVKEDEIAGFVKVESGTVYIFFEGDKIIDITKENNYEV